MEKKLSQQVYEIVAQIPRGSVTTYGSLAFRIGHPRASRLIGQFMRNAPDGLPCHRVVSKTGRLSPELVFGGVTIQRMLLENEGVPFLESGLIDLEACFWGGD